MDPSLFVSAESLKELELPDGQPELTKPLGRMIANLEAVEMIQ